MQPSIASDLIHDEVGDVLADYRSTVKAEQTHERANLAPAGLAAQDLNSLSNRSPHARLSSACAGNADEAQDLYGL